MKAIILTIGNEVLSGQVVDTNAAWLGQQLSAEGISVKEKWSVADILEDIVEALNHSTSRGDLVITTGGLGPTADDLTCEALANYLGVARIFHEETFENLTKIIASFGKGPTESHRAQCMLPYGVTILPNTSGTAPGMYIKHQKVHIISLPGVPFEMKAIFYPHIKELLSRIKSGPKRMSHTFNTIGEGETVLEDKIRDITAAAPHHISFAFLPDLYRVRIRVDLDSDSPEDYAIWLNILASIRTVLKRYIAGENEVTLEVAIGQILQQKKWMLSTAESCTGGYLAHMITAISGSSAYYQGSIIAYHNDVKSGQLHVAQETLSKFGAVSEEVVIAMAQGVLATLSTQVSIAVTGVAGPGGGSLEKPVGLVWIALSDSNGRVKTFKINLRRDRITNIRAAAAMALIQLHRFLLDE